MKAIRIFHKVFLTVAAVSTLSTTFLFSEPEHVTAINIRSTQNINKDVNH
ncbi:hypothetical protein [Lactobacillus sp. LL6]|nr:hypothetical protein [Lactobacillus sp. LL6]